MLLRNKIILIISFFLALLFIAALLFRQSILEYGVHKVQEKLLNRYRAALTIGDCGFEGIRDVYFKKIVFAPLIGDTLLTIQNVELKVSIGLLLRMKIGFKEMYADSVFIHTVKKGSTSNYSFLFKKNADADSSIITTATNYQERIVNMLEKVNRIFSSNILIKEIMLISDVDNATEVLRIPALACDGHQYKFDVITTSLSGVAAYEVKGTANPAESHYNVNMKKLSGESESLPFFDLIDSMKVDFESAKMNISAGDDAEKLPIIFDFSISQLRLHHWRISQTDVKFNTINCSFVASVFNDGFSIDSGSVLQFNQVPINIQASYQRKPDPRVKLDINCKTTGQDFFGSLPDGMFSTLKGFQASGKLNYSLHFDLNKNEPDKLEFESRFDRENFRITKYGDEYFPRINEPFFYTAMDGDRVMRNLMVGEGNPFFTPLSQISEYLKNAVLTSEDPSFFTHSGFVEEAFRESIAENIKQGRFARGGSTISMQLVKNVFLSRNKTVSRKLEEALIVWLIEKNRIVIKDRMYEIYLNIIEWGPDVYGIGEASKFYFDKHPQDLSLSESIYLSEIIPHPKYFKYAFDSSGQLKANHQGYFDLIGNRLLSREKITQVEHDSLNAKVKLYGRALQMILPADTIPVDSLELEEIKLLE